MEEAMKEPKQSCPASKCPYCGAFVRPSVKATNGIVPVGNQTGCEFCNPEPPFGVRPCGASS
jgi:hypothetical protein